MARARGRLTQKAVDAFHFDPARAASSQQILWCRAMPGFGVRVFAGGRKSYLCRYRWPRGRAGRQRLVTLGQGELISLEEARDRARQMLARAWDGQDPAEERARLRAAESFAELGRAYLAAHTSKRSAEDDRQRFRDWIEPALGSLPVLAVRRTDVQRLHERVATVRSGGTANAVLRVVSVIFSWALQTGRLPEDSVHPCRGVKRARKVERDRYLSRDEAARLFAELEKCEDARLRAFVLLALATGCRRGELLGARWGDVDRAGRLLRLRSTKNGRAHSVPLSELALRALALLPRLAGDDRLFPPSARSGAAYAPNKPWRRLCRAAGVADVNIHDLRRTTGSWLAQSGESLHVIGAVLNHSGPAVTQVYARLADRNRSEALEAHSREVLALLPSAAGAAERGL